MGSLVLMISKSLFNIPEEKSSKKENKNKITALTYIYMYVCVLLLFSISFLFIEPVMLLWFPIYFRLGFKSLRLDNPNCPQHKAQGMNDKMILSLTNVVTIQLRNVLWCQVHLSHIHSNHETSLNYNKSKQQTAG